MKSIQRTGFILICLLVLVYVPVHQPVAAQTERSFSFTVNTTNDTHDVLIGDGNCKDNNNNCSLRAALEEAMTRDGVTIYLPGDNTYDIGTAGNGISVIGDELLSISIVGQGGNTNPVITGVDGNYSTFSVQNASLSLSYITLSTTSHITVSNGGKLNLFTVTLSAMTALTSGGGSGGGAVYLGQDAELDVLNCTFIGNSTGTGGKGGAILNNRGIVNITASNFLNNSATYGGAIYSENDGSAYLKIMSSLFTENIASEFGGALFINGYNIQSASSSQAQIIESRIYKNSAPNGGGIYVGDGALPTDPYPRGGVNITFSEISENIATTGSGGGMYINNADNTGGSFYVYMENSTISGNEAFNRGGGIYINQNGGDAVYGYNITISNNAADREGESSGNGGGLYNETNYSLHLFNSILAANRDLSTGLSFKIPDCYGKLSIDYSLVGMVFTSFCTLEGDTSTSIYSTTTALSPELGALSDNNAFARYHPLLSTSPAVNHGNPQGCKGIGNTLLTKDQRQYPRPKGSACDIGAYESSFVDYQVFLPAIRR